MVLTPPKPTECADAFGLPTLFVTAAIVSMTPLLLMPILSNRAMDEAERDVE